MSDTEKVYYPAEIAENPLPSDQVATDTTVSSVAGSDTKPAQTEKIVDNPLPRRVIASEVIGSVLNTKSKKILAEIEFTPSGALQIGKYIFAVSGDVRLSPVGIIARNQLGETTFALDGDTGDAVFKGQVLAGSFLAQDDDGNYVTVDGERILIHDGPTNKNIVLIGKF